MFRALELFSEVLAKNGSATGRIVWPERSKTEEGHWEISATPGVTEIVQSDCQNMGAAGLSAFGGNACRFEWPALGRHHGVTQCGHRFSLRRLARWHGERSPTFHRWQRRCHLPGIAGPLCR